MMKIMVEILKRINQILICVDFWISMNHLAFGVMEFRTSAIFFLVSIRSFLTFFTSSN